MKFTARGSDTAARINRCMLELFDEWLPAAVEMPPARMPSRGMALMN